MECCSTAKPNGRDNEALSFIEVQCELAKTIFSIYKGPSTMYNDVISMGIAFEEPKDILATFW